jgi:dTDP-glucose 4,6-dehydratase
MNKLNILVTGGSGFIASHLVDRLISYGHFVVNLDKLDYCSYDNTKSMNGIYKFIQGNICNKELVWFIFNEYKINVIYHLAAQTHVDNSFFNSTQFTTDNIVGTHNLLECTREYNEINSADKILKFIHMSTDEVYGEIKEGENECSETSLLKPTNPYSATKASAELLASSYYYSFKLPIKIIRCNNVFGPRQYPEKVIPSFIYNLLNNEKCQIHGFGNTERHFIYVENVIDAILIISEQGNINEVYNIATNECYKIKDLAKMLIKKIKNVNILNHKDLENYVNYIDDRKFNDYRYLINSNKLEKLGWKNKINFEEGLNKTIEYFKNIN